ncbi:undecaprenyl-diphosphatase [Lachnospiraceae bacterium KM106-2]|nr:undecaprenyl-diphosphatase [Lachnospiraceae bacterium KM106-2]
MIEILKTLILGIVEGITEWLPISSTGHMILVDEFLKMNQSEAFMKMFQVVIQLGAIMAVVVLYWNKIFPFGIKKNNVDTVYDKKQDITFYKGKFYVDMSMIIMWLKIAVACIPSIIIGLPFDDKIDAMFYNFQTVAITLIIYGVLFIVVENWNKGRKPCMTDMEDITFQAAAIIGIFQVLALIPGTSRSGATIIGGLLIGMSRTLAAEFTFFLAIPTMFGASLLKLIKFGFHFSSMEIVILFIGMLSAYLVSVFAIKFLMSYIKKHDFKFFGYYRIVLGIIVIGYWIFK